MNDILLLIIIFGSFYTILLGVTGWLVWKQWNYRTKTPAEQFLKARKKGKILCIDLFESGKVDYFVSDRSDKIVTEGEITNLSPLSTFIDGKSKVTTAIRYNTSGVSGQTLSPMFVFLTQKISEYLKKGVNNINALYNSVLDAKENKDNNEKTILSLNHIKSFLRYNDSKGNYTSAHRIAGLMYKKTWKDTMKFIALLIGGAIAGVILLGGIYIIITKLNMNPEIIIDFAKETNNTINATML